MKTLPTASEDKLSILPPKAYRAAQAASFVRDISALARSQDRMDAGKRADAPSLSSTATGAALTPPKGHSPAAQPTARVLPRKPATSADAAATAALPNPLWARVRNFLRL